MKIYPAEVKSGRTGENTEAIRNSYDRIFGKKNISRKVSESKKENSDVK